MKLLDKPAKITKPLYLTFNISEGGWCLVSVSARVKSEKRRGENETNDEDLTVQVDNQTFPHPGSEGRLIDSPASFNGGKLHNRLQTIYFILHLESGKHVINLEPQFGAKVKEVSVDKLPIPDSKIDLSLEKTAEDGNNRPWVTFVLVDLPLTSITASVTARWHFPDGDDVKLIVNGEIKKNYHSLLHKNWTWASSIIRKVFDDETVEKTFKEGLPPNLHYIEFYADETPTLHKISFDVGEVPLPHPQAKVVVEGANLREETSQESSSLITFNTGDVVEVSQRAIEGEAPYKERGDFTNTWHKVRFREVEGYVFSKAIEIEGEDFNSISKEITQAAREFNLDITLALAIAKKESKFFPYAVSEAGAKGVFQVTENALGDIKGEFRPTNIFDLRQNIEAGVRYLLKLRDHYFKDDPEQEQKVIAAYNAGPDAIRAGVLLSNQWISSETKDYISDVLAFRKEFQRGKGPVLLRGLFLLLLLSGVFLVRLNSPADLSGVLGDTIERSKTDEFANTEKSLIVDLDENGVAEEIVFVESGPTPVLSRVSSYLRQGDKFTFVDQVSGYFYKAQAIDLDEDGVKELVLEVVTGHLFTTTLYRYDNGILEYVPEVSSKFHGLSSESGAVIANINHSESKELILYSFWPPDEECESIARIYLYRRGQLVKYLDAVVAEEFCRLKPTFWGI